MLQTLVSYGVARPPWGRCSPAMTGHRYEDVHKTELEVANTKLVYGEPIKGESVAQTPDDVMLFLDPKVVNLKALWWCPTFLSCKVVGSQSSNRSSSS